jgi:hypothetical protein
METEFEIEEKAKERAKYRKMVLDFVNFQEGVIAHLQEKAKEQKAAGLHAEAEQTLLELASAKRELAKTIADHRGIFPPAAVKPAISNVLPRAIVVSALLIAGAALLCVLMATGAKWYYAEMVFALAAYLVWQHYF